MRCQISDCSNAEVEQLLLNPCLHIWANKFAGEKPIKCGIGVNVCDQCSMRCKVDDFLNEPLWNIICEAFTQQKRPMPDRRTVELTFMKPPQYKTGDVEPPTCPALEIVK